MVNILNPLDRLALARNHLQASRSYAAAVIDRIRRIEVLLGPTCRDTVTAIVELRGVLGDLEQLPMRPATGSATGVDPLKQDGRPQRMAGVGEATEHVRAVLTVLDVNV